jgi:hypothetical protein
LTKAQEPDTLSRKNEEGFNFAGYVNTVALKNIKADYAIVEAEGLSNSFISAVYSVSFDYGQQWNREKELELRDERGKRLAFRSLSHLLNFLDDNGWILMEVLNNSQPGKSTKLIMKRKNHF